MKYHWLWSIVVAALGVPIASGKTELETLRARCAEMERQIRELEQDNSKLREMNGMTAKFPVRPASAQPSPAADDNAAPRRSAAATSTYAVRKGDSWERIARHHGITPKALAEMNGATADSILQEGRSIKVPSGAAPAAQAPAAAAPRTTGGRTHTVEDGDTYYAIGKKYNIPVSVLEAANPNIKATALRPGLKIRLDPATAPATTATTSRRTSTPTAETAPPRTAPSTPPRTAAATPAPTPPKAAPAAPPPPPPVTSKSPVARSTAAAPASAEPRLTVTTPTAQTPIKSTSAVRSVPIMESITYADFAKQHGTTVQRLNSLNYLNLPETTILARGAELLVPAQP